MCRPFLIRTYNQYKGSNLFNAKTQRIRGKSQSKSSKKQTSEKVFFAPFFTLSAFALKFIGLL